MEEEEAQKKKGSLMPNWGKKGIIHDKLDTMVIMPKYTISQSIRCLGIFVFPVALSRRT